MSSESSEPKTISAALNGHRNSFGAIRLILAASVIVSHSWPLAVNEVDPTHHLFRGQAHIGTIAVLGFMAISGYVVTKSAASADVVQFMWRRFLRMFPAYWVALVVAAFVIGPLALVLAGDAVGGYFTTAAGGPFSYVMQNLDLTVRQWEVSGLFVGQPSESLNGSLWTLAYEWGCYLGIAALAVFGVLRRARFLIPVGALVFVALQAMHLYAPDVVARLPLVSTEDRVMLTLMFLWGSTLAVYSRKIRMTDRAAMVALAVTVATLLLGWFYLLGLPAMAYFVCWAAARLPSRLHSIGADTDYSYGVYLYGWPVQQFGIALGLHHVLGQWGWTVVSLAGAFALAWLSWHLLERRTEDLKGVGPGRGIHYWTQRMRSPRGRSGGADQAHAEDERRVGEGVGGVSSEAQQVDRAEPLAVGGDVALDAVDERRGVGRGGEGRG